MCECGVVGQNSSGEEERDACVARGLNIPREFRRPLACGRSVPGVLLGMLKVCPRSTGYWHLIGIPRFQKKLAARVSAAQRGGPNQRWQSKHRVEGCIIRFGSRDHDSDCAAVRPPFSRHSKRLARLCALVSAFATHERP